MDSILLGIVIGIAVKIENIVCSGTFNQLIDLKRLSDECNLFEYGRNRYHGGYLRFDSHSVTVYRTGSYIIPGLRSFDDVHTSFSKVKEILSPYLDVSLFDEPQVKNVVCSSSVGHELDLSRLYVELISKDMDAIYEPEAFPGLILKVGGCTYNIFSSGKFVILGCTMERQAEGAERFFLELVDDI